jgi:hypothetical protein
MRTWLLAIFAAALLTSCTSEKETHLISACQDEYYSRGLYNKETGERVTPKNNSSIYLLTLHVCRAKVGLFAEGYRVNPIIEENDIAIYLAKDAGALESYYKKKISLRN